MATVGCASGSATGARARARSQVDADGDAVFSVAVSPDERSLAAATGATDGVTLWNIETGKRHVSSTGSRPIRSTSRSRSDGDALVSSNREGIVTLWNSATGQSIGPRFDYHSDTVWRLAVTPGWARGYGG